MGTASESMNQPGWNHTIFAPIDAAFDALDDDALETLFEPEGATPLLRKHIVPRIVPSTDLETGELLTVGRPISVIVDGSSIRYGDAGVVETDIEASNGVIHVIDAVVLL